MPPLLRVLPFLMFLILLGMLTPVYSGKTYTAQNIIDFSKKEKIGIKIVQGNPIDNTTIVAHKRIWRYRYPPNWTCEKYFWFNETGVCRTYSHGVRVNKSFLVNGTLIVFSGKGILRVFVEDLCVAVVNVTCNTTFSFVYPRKYLKKDPYNPGWYRWYITFKYHGTENSCVAMFFYVIQFWNASVVFDVSVNASYPAALRNLSFFMSFNATNQTVMMKKDGRRVYLTNNTISIVTKKPEINFRIYIVDENNSFVLKLNYSAVAYYHYVTPYVSLEYSPENPSAGNTLIISVSVVKGSCRLYRILFLAVFNNTTIYNTTLYASKSYNFTIAYTPQTNGTLHVTIIAFDKYNFNTTLNADIHIGIVPPVNVAAIATAVGATAGVIGIALLVKHIYSRRKLREFAVE